MIQLHQLQPIHKRKKRKRIGRGGKRGGSSGFGVQHGGGSPPPIRAVLKRYPKLLGYRMKRRKDMKSVVNVGMLEKKFEEKALVTPEVLVEKNLVSKVGGKIPQVKILGEGELKKALFIKGCEVSKSALLKIQKAGGKIL